MKYGFGARLTLMLACILGMGTVAAARISYLNITDRDFLREQGEARSVRTEVSSALRGVIRDRRGEPLAVSTPVDSVWVDPTAKPELDPLAVAITARVLGLDLAQLRKRLADNAKREFVYVARRVDAEHSATLKAELAARKLGGVHFRREYKRYYPAGEIAAHIVGLTNIDDHGVEGAELTFNTELRGEQGSKRVLKDRRGKIVRDLEYIAAERPGEDLSLTIDLRLQYMAYRELKRAVNEQGAKSASLVMLDANTAEVLAMANLPSFNPNRRLPGGPAALRNKAVTDLYEPGSTLKPFAMTAGLETGVIRTDTLIDTNPGYIRVANKTIKDPHNKGVLSLGQILAQSSQVGITKVALQLSEQALPSVLQRVGLTERTGCKLPGEALGALPVNPRLPLVRATLAYGYGFTATPLQLARAYSVFAAGGILRPVSVVRRAHVPDGVRVVDARVAAQIARMLEGVVGVGGTAPKARVPGYRIAGKTGTARKVGANGRYVDDRHVAFFAGFAPATAPRIVVVIIVDDPSGARFGGGDIAAPVFGRVAAQALRLLEVPPDGDIQDWGGTI